MIWASRVAEQHSRATPTDPIVGRTIKTNILTTTKLSNLLQGHVSMSYVGPMTGTRRPSLRKVAPLLNSDSQPDLVSMELYGLKRFFCFDPLFMC